MIPKPKKAIIGSKKLKHQELSEVSVQVVFKVMIASLIRDQILVIFYDHGQFSPVTSDWQRQKCKAFMCTYVGGVI